MKEMVKEIAKEILVFILLLTFGTALMAIPLTFLAMALMRLN